MDEDWRSEPPYAIDEFLKLTEDKKAPVDGLEDVKNKVAKNHGYTSWDSMSKNLKMNGVYEQNIGVFYTEAMQEHASQERNRAIQECIERLDFKTIGCGGEFTEGLEYAIEILRKLKK